MGFFDNILKDIASGDIEKKLEKLADTVEKFSDRVEDKAKGAVDTSEKVVQKVDQVGQRTIKTIDGIKK